MVTRFEWLSKARSLLNQKVIVATNPYGGQCAAFVDFMVRWGTGGNGHTGGTKNLAWTNAIDLLVTASRMGLKIHYFSGNNYDWKAGDIWVTASPYHRFGHTGLFETAGDRPTTLEQNVDGNPDALTNGGWVRRKSRTVWSDKGMTYSDLPERQILIGWIEAPVTDEDEEALKRAKEEAERTARLNKIKRGSGMYGSFFFTVKEGTPEFGKGTLFFYNTSSNEITALSHGQEEKAITDLYKNTYGELPKSVTYTVSAPWFVRLFDGLKAKRSWSRTKQDDVLDLLKKVQAGNTSITQAIEKMEQRPETAKTELSSGQTDLIKGMDITDYTGFTARVPLNIRRDPSTKSQKLGVLKAGEMVKILGSAYADSFYWVAFEHEGQPAYVASKAVGGDFTGKLS